MKAVFVGGGALRHLGILRSALAAGVFNNGHIVLQDLNVARAQAMGGAIQKSPEFTGKNCQVSWGLPLEKALEGADVVSIVLMAGSPLSYAQSSAECPKFGFIGSDNVSISGDFLAVKGGRTVMGIARKMEQYCPKALLLDFANPIAVFSAMVNNHTKIRCLGVCQGYTNHQWDLCRLLLAEDRGDDSFDVQVAGVNHLSFIVRGKYQGQDLFKLLDARFASGQFCDPKLQDFWSPASKKNILGAVKNLHRFYTQLGLLIFSTEGDGMAHLKYDEDVAAQRRQAPATSAQIAKKLKLNAQDRAKADAEFVAGLALADSPEAPAAPSFWKKHEGTSSVFSRDDNSVFVRVLQAVGGKKPVRLVASTLNNGAIKGFTDRTVVEYSMTLQGSKVTPVGDLVVPPQGQGIVASLAAHQTLLADAIATDDPKLLAQALLTYPIRPYSKDLSKLCKRQIAINRKEMPEPLRAASQYL